MQILLATAVAKKPTAKKSDLQNLLTHMQNNYNAAGRMSGDGFSLGLSSKTRHMSLKVTADKAVGTMSYDGNDDLEPVYRVECEASLPNLTKLVKWVRSKKTDAPPFVV